jgi:homocitrate synthase NifV
MKPRRFLVDTTLRDGVQSPLLRMTRQQRVRAARFLAEAGIYQIEAGSPAVGEYERETIRMIRAACPEVKLSVWSRLDKSDALTCLECAPDIIHLCAPASYRHIYTKMEKNKAWILRQLQECLTALEGSAPEITVGFEDASQADTAFMIRLLSTTRAFGVRRIRLADTVGILSPSGTLELVETILEQGGVDVEFHAHNDLGMAVANTIEAAKTGALYADVTLAGVGERAGNCDLSKLITASERLFDWGVSPVTALALDEAFGELRDGPDGTCPENE